MDNDSIVRALVRLYDAECRSLLHHLGRAQPFVSWASAADQRLVDGMISEEAEHQRQLLDLIHALGGSPPLPTFSSECGALAYLDLHALLPRIVQDKRNLVAEYAAVAPQVGDDRRAAALVGRILEREQVHLAALEKLHTSAGRIAGATR
ncbi:MAG: hypothetical protein L6Q92_03120 [Phycisphaerae bacterium]|nr:hypothetical protein [Phycisphaerae bacterium]